MCTYIHSTNAHAHARMFTIYYNVRRTSSLHNNSTKRCFFVLVGGLLLYLAAVEPHACSSNNRSHFVCNYTLCHVFKILFALVHLFSLQAHYCFFHPHCAAFMLTLSICARAARLLDVTHISKFSFSQSFCAVVLIEAFDLYPAVLPVDFSHNKKLKFPAQNASVLLFFLCLR